MLVLVADEERRIAAWPAQLTDPLGLHSISPVPTMSHAPIELDDLPVDDRFAR